jgi:hypothetical protein
MTSPKTVRAVLADMNVGAALLPVPLPKNVFAAADDSVKLRAGVVVDVATDEVKRGDRLPDEKLVTVPPLGAIHERVPVVVEDKTNPFVPGFPSQGSYPPLPETGMSSTVARVPSCDGRVIVTEVVSSPLGCSVTSPPEAKASNFKMPG